MRALFARRAAVARLHRLRPAAAGPDHQLFVHAKSELLPSRSSAAPLHTRYRVGETLQDPVAIIREEPLDLAKQ